MSNELHFTITENGDEMAIAQSSTTTTTKVAAPTSIEAVDNGERMDHDDDLQTAGGAHPCAIVIHVLFKALALFVYVFMPFSYNGNSTYYYYSKPFAYTPWAIFVILLLTADFLVVKKVTGRQLVSLEWCFQVNYNLSTMTWNIDFESTNVENQESTVSNCNNICGRRVFWTTLYTAPIFWACFLMWAVITWQISWLMLCIVALSLTGANACGYYKCVHNTDQGRTVRFQQMTIQQSDE